MKRDIEVNKHLEQKGWKVIRFWGKEILKNVKLCVDKIEMEVENRRVKKWV